MSKGCPETLQLFEIDETDSRSALRHNYFIKIKFDIGHVYYGMQILIPMKSGLLPGQYGLMLLTALHSEQFMVQTIILRKLYHSIIQNAQLEAIYTIIGGSQKTIFLY